MITALVVLLVLGAEGSYRVNQRRSAEDTARSLKFADLYSEGSGLLMQRRVPEHLTYYVAATVEVLMQEWHRELYQFIQKEWGQVAADIYVQRGIPSPDATVYDRIEARLIYLESLWSQRPLANGQLVPA